MLKIASWVTRSALILAGLVGVAAIGIVASMLLPDTGQDESCELKTPYLVGGKGAAGEDLEVVVDPAGCDLDLRDGQLIYLEFSVTDAPVPQEGQSQAQMAADGSMQAMLPVDPRNTSGQLVVTVHGGVPGCDEDYAACAAWIHELDTRIEVLK